MSDLISLKNIGKKLQDQLNAVGITTAEELIATGSKEAWSRIKAIDPSACIMRLSALEGAIQGVAWQKLSEDTKASLKEYYHAHK